MGRGQREEGRRSKSGWVSRGKLVVSTAWPVRMTHGGHLLSSKS